jgi:predicted double-glycine peptidase
VLIHIEREDYKHFAIFRGIRGNRVYLADPSRGETRMVVERFSYEWTGVALVLGKRGFGTPTQYPLAIADCEIATDETLAARRALYSR